MARQVKGINLDHAIKKEKLVRKDSTFRDWVTADGVSGFKAEAGRYHLYVCLACPWAHRTLMVRQLKGLNDVISATAVDWYLDSRGWLFNDKVPKCTKDEVNGKTSMKEVFELADPNYKGSISVPVLWDKKNKTIVNIDSGDIIRMLNSEFNEFCPTPAEKKLHFYPEQLKEKIDVVNEWISPMINNGVYTTGLAKSQEAYDTAVKDVFSALDKAETILSKNRYLTGKHFTEADIRLFTTLIRFDPVYVGHFKCNKRRLVDYPHLWAYTREIYQMPGVKVTCDQEHIQKHYQMSDNTINPFRIVAIGPELNYDEPHGRDKLFQGDVTDTRV